MARDITQDDLDEDNLKVLNSGAYQVLPNRDRADRAVVLVVPNVLNKHDRTNRVRTSLSSLFVFAPIVKTFFASHRLNFFLSFVFEISLETCNMVYNNESITR